MKRIRRLALVVTGFLIFSFFTNINTKKVSAQEVVKVEKHNNTIETAQNIEINSTVTASIKEKDENWYSFNVSEDSAQNVQISVKSGNAACKYHLLYGNGNGIYDSLLKWPYAYDQIIYDKHNNYYLDPGKYYIVISDYDNNAPCDYTLSITGTKVHNNDLSDNKSFDRAQSINFGSTLTGVISESDEEKNAYEYYKIDVKKSGIVNFDFRYNMQDIDLGLYDQNKDIVAMDFLTSTNKQGKNTKNLYLDKGIYYVMVASSFAGKYNLKMSYTDIHSNEQNNDSFENPQKIDINNSYNAMISEKFIYGKDGKYGKGAEAGEDGDVDWYTFNISKPQYVYINSKFQLNKLAYEIYDNDEKVVKSSMHYKDKKLGYGKIHDKVYLKKGKYSICFNGDEETGTYNFSIDGYISNIETPKNNAKVSGKTTIRGWYLYGKQISRIDVYIDGKKLGQATRSRRDDVAKVFKGNDCSKAGFSYTVDLSKYKKGSHKIEIKAIGTDGTSNSTFRTIKVA